MRLYNPNAGFIESDRSTNVANLLANGWVEVVTEQLQETKQPEQIYLTEKIYNTQKNKRGYK